MEKVYVCGHRHPDTDSIVSAIAYSYLKQRQGEYAIACRLGPVNQETKYLLNRFDFDEPVALEDARIRLNEIDLEKPIAVYEDETIFETLDKMKYYQQPYVCVVDHHNKVKGMVTRNDLADIGLGDTALGIDLLKNASLSNICKTLQGKIIVDDEQMHLNGKVSIVALSQRLSADYEVRDRIVIIGDDPVSQKHLIQKGAGLLVVVWAKEIQEDVIELAKEYHCPILISGYGSMNTSRYLFFSPSISSVMKENVMCFYEDEYLEDVAKKMVRKRYRAYPVIDKENYLVGYILKDHAMNHQNKTLILVDHNEFSQSVKNIEKACVKEVIDHHRVYDFYSSEPIFFRNEIVGSSATIITSMFMEQEIEIPKNLAGLLLGAIISDTLNFQSPTTTAKDIRIAEKLEAIAQLNMDEFAYDILFMNSNIESKNISDFLKEDVKSFDIEGYRVIIAQVVIPSCDCMKTMHEAIQEELVHYARKKGCDLVSLVLTSVTDNGSYFYNEGKISQWVDQELEIEHGYPKFLENIVSRKKQIVPMITQIIQKNA